MKKVISIIFVIVSLYVCFTLPVLSAEKLDMISANSEFALDIGDVVTEVDGVVDVPINITYNPGIKDIYFELKFDRTKLNIMDVKNGNVLTEGILSFEDTDSGLIVNIADCDNIYFTDGILCVLTFQIGDNVGDNSSEVIYFDNVSNNNAYATNIENEKVLCMTHEGKVRINPQYDVCFVNNNGSNHHTYSYGDKIEYMPQSSIGIFDGWYKDVSLTEKWDIKNSVVTSDITLYAGYKKSKALISNMKASIYNAHTIVDFDITNTSANIANAKALIQMFADNNKLIALKIESIDVHEFESGKFRFEYDIDSCSRVSVTLWDPFSTASPIAEEVSCVALNTRKITYNLAYTGSKITEEYEEYEKAITSLPTPKRIGYSFVGWATNTGADWKNDNTVTSDTVLYAKWKKNDYKVSFVYGANLINTQQVEFGAKTEAPRETVYGCDIEGWYTSDGNLWDFSEDCIVTDTILYAKCSLKDYTVTFSTDGGSAVEQKSVKYNSLITKPQDPILEGYNFGGWYTDKQYSSNGEWDFSTKKVTENITLYAKWNVNLYTVTFEANGGSTVNSQNVAFNGTVMPVETSKAGYLLEGWYTSDGIKWLFDGSDGANVVRENITLSARWVPDVVSIEFDVNGGDNTLDIKKVPHGGTYGELPTPSREGYIFEGWYTSLENGKRITASSPVTVYGTVVLYAKWSIKKYHDYLIAYDAVSTKEYNGHRYQLYNLELTWEEAREYCRLLGGYLAVITSNEENDIVTAMGKGTNRWLGGTDEIKDGEWKWINGEEFTYENWYEGEPNNEGVNGERENYMHINNQNQWNDAVNTSKYGFICEFDEIDNEAPVISKLEVVEKDLTGYTVRCKVSDESGVIKKVQWPTWTRYKGQDDIVDSWSINSKASGNFDGEYYIYRINISEHNNELGAYATHVYAYDGQGNVSRVYLCGDDEKWDINVLNSPSQTIYYNNHIYERYDDEVTWPAARYSSNLLGGNLVCITSEVENTVVHDLIKSGSISSYHIGATDSDTEGQWKWMSGADFAYNNWNEGEPNNTGEGEDGAVMFNNNTTSGKWNDVSISTKAGFVCEYYNPKPIASFWVNDRIHQVFDYELSEEDIDKFCSERGGTRVDVDKEKFPDYTFAYDIPIDFKPVATASYNGHTYMKFDKKFVFEDAKTICQAMGGHLASITSEAEQAVIFGMTTDKVATYWIGGIDESIDAYQDGVFKWITGEKMNYKNWFSGEPNQLDEEDFITISYEDGMWNDLAGSCLRGFICEIDD